MDHDFALNWLNSGRGFVDNSLTDEAYHAWLREEDLCRAAALHSRSLYECRFIPCDFKDSVPFVLDILEQRPEYFHVAGDMAKSDPLVLTTTIAAMPQRDFSACILGNMLAGQTVEETGTDLTRLNQGVETSQNYKKLLAAHLGIPTGKWLKRLHQAELHVEQAIAPWNPEA